MGLPASFSCEDRASGTQGTGAAANCRLRNLMCGTWISRGTCFRALWEVGRNPSLLKSDHFCKVIRGERVASGFVTSESTVGKHRIVQQR